MNRIWLFAAVAVLCGCEDKAARPASTSDAPPAAANADPAVAPAPAAGDAVVLSEFVFPGGTVTVPKSWSPAFVNEPPKVSLHVTPAPDVTCDLAVLIGHGTDKQAEDYLNAGAATFDGDPQKAPAITVGGAAFQGIRVQTPKALADSPGAFVDLYASVSGPDLITLGLMNLSPDENTARRTECLRAFAALPQSRAEAASP